MHAAKSSFAVRLSRHLSEMTSRADYPMRAWHPPASIRLSPASWVTWDAIHREEIMDIGALGLWIFFASIIVASTWAKSRREAEKHETLRRIVEKTGQIDEAKLKELFKEEAPQVSKPGGGYRWARVIGAIVLSIGAAIATGILIVAGLGKVFGEARMFADITWLIVGPAIASGIAMLGLGIFFSSRFCEPPTR
jgi:hypothetical protein